MTPVNRFIMESDHLIARKDIVTLSRRLHKQGRKIVFTNGVFDILHLGHVNYLASAKSFGDVLMIGVNTDASVRRLKGSSRPVQSQRDRALILLALSSVDYTVLFGEDTPAMLIAQIKPDVLVKGADYKISEIVGADFVRSYGGEVRRIKLVRGRSSSRIIDLLNK